MTDQLQTGDGTDEGPAYPPRRAPRMHVYGELVGEVSAHFEAALVDLSLLGACVEHTRQMQPGQGYILQLSFADLSIRLPARAVWSTVHGAEKMGAKRLLYRTGLEFVSPPSGALEALRDLMARKAPRMSVEAQGDAADAAGR